MRGDFEYRFKAFADEFGTYLEDIRRRVLLCAAFFVLAFAVGFFCSPFIIHTLVQVLALDNVEYVVSSPFQVLSMSMDMGFTAAIAAVFPLILTEIYVFAAPALRKREQRTVLWYAFMSACLFLLGFAYGIAVMYYATWAIASFNGTLGLVNLWDLGAFVSLMIVTSALLGVLFQFPLIVSAIIRMGLLPREFFAGKRRVVIAIVIIIVALLPPTDGLSLVVMALPLVGLYELTLLLTKWGGGRADAQPSYG